MGVLYATAENSALLKKTRKHGNCECIATWGSPTPRSPFLLWFVACAKFEVAQPIRCRFRAFYCLYVTLRCDLEHRPRDLDLWPLTLNIWSVPAVPWWNSVRNLSSIGQSVAELLQFEVWPFDLEHVARVALCSEILHTKFKLGQAIRSRNVTIFSR